jgi:hypothetical protein
VRVCRVYLEPDVACRFLQLLRRTGTEPGALTILAGTGAVTPFLFSDLPRPLPCGSGDKRRAAQRPSEQTPVPVPPGFHQVFPTAIPAPTRHLRELPRRSASGDRRARVRGPREGRVYCRPREPRFRVSRVRCMHFEEYMRTKRSLPQHPLDIRCRRCVAERGGDPFPTADRTKAYVPTPSREGRRHPVDRDAFHRCEARQAFERGFLHTRI